MVEKNIDLSQYGICFNCRNWKKEDTNRGSCTTPTINEDLKPHPAYSFHTCDVVDEEGNVMFKSRIESTE